jgi:eukaryotic-like serine/threonine-protein kinase
MERDSGTKDTAYPLIGQVVGGRYHIIELVGEGGMGVVYKAEQRLGSTLRKVAVKTLHAELSRDPAITARFHREVGTVAQLEHPNTVRVYDFGSTDDGTLYIAMEFLDGRPLNKVIESEGPLEPQRVVNLVRQVAGSLDEAHGHGIIHRDLKPENVLLIQRAGEKDVVKLVDFGIAARTESADREKEQKLTQQGMVLGTPPYMSPEQFTGKHLDARSDVYSLGIMAYEMFTGQLPFQADTPWQWATHHMTSQPRSFDEIPNGNRIQEPLRRAVLKALSKDPQERQSSAGQFYAELNAGLQAGDKAAFRPVLAGKTEAMTQAPAFGMAPTAGMPAAPGLARAATVASAASAPVALPPAPVPTRTSGGKALIYGLSGIGAILLVAMGVVALNKGGGAGTPPPIDLTARDTPVTPTSEAVPAAPEQAPKSEAEPAAVDSPAAEPAPKATKTPKPAASKPATPSPAASTPSRTPAATPAPAATPPVSVPAQLPQAKPPVVQAPPPATQPAPTQPAPTQPAPAQPAPAQPAAGADACASCIIAAKSGNFTAAAGAYAQCSNPGGKKACTTRVAQTAPRQAEAAALNQRCDEARGIIAAARAVGVPEGRLAKADAACK